MSQTLTISDHLLARLEAAARRRGLNSVEQLLETWQAREEELARFHILAERWKKETAHQSNMAKKALHPAYQEIIGMGERVVPLLLAELRREPDDWFWACTRSPGPTLCRPRAAETCVRWPKPGSSGVRKRVQGMTDRLQHLEEIFPDLAAAGYSPKSEKSGVYNCIAYAAGDETRKWEGYREIGYYWPEGAKEGHTLDALMSAFEQTGVCYLRQRRS